LVITFPSGDSLYIKDLTKKTHRGLEGRALSGFHTGDRCLGYSNESQKKALTGVRITLLLVDGT
jgi:hypothetical protein